MDVCDVIVQNTRVAIERSICNDIIKSISERKKDDEVEVRFGYSLSGKYQGGLATDPAESRDKWYSLMKLLKDSSLYTNQGIEKTLVEVYGNLRKIICLSKPGPPTFQDKVKLKNLDIFKFRVGETDHTIRLGLASEKERKEATPSGIPDYVRIRTRASFLSTSGTLRFDLTFVPPNVYEVEIEYLTSVDLTKFFEPVKLVVHVIQANNEVITVDEHSHIIKEYNSFFSEYKFDESKITKKGLPQPVNLKRHHIPGMTAYSATDKLNGTRIIGMVYRGNVYVINMAGRIDKFATEIKSLERTLFDAELFEDTIYAFDLLFLAGKDYRNYNLDVRLGALSKLVDTINNQRIKMKKFYMSGNLGSDTVKVFEHIDTLEPEDNDGIIYTPITEPYLNMSTYKWKPARDLTIDFQALPIGNNQYLLQVTGRNKASKLEVFKKPKFNGTITSETPLKGVGEYRWDGSTFKLVRPRPDKEAPNYIDIANDNWEDIMNPISRDELISLLNDDMIGRDAVRKYNNSVKRELINQYLAKKRVLDLGAGKGGDLFKYKEAGIDALFAVEPNPKNYDELKARASKMESKHQLTFKLEAIKAKAQDTEVIVSGLRGEKLPAATSFFALSFFFENEASIDGLIKTLDACVDKNGYFIGTTIDGDAVRKLFASDGDKIELGPIIIQKKYYDFTGPIKYNKRISYQYLDSATVAEEQTEYLVDWEEMIMKMGQIGFDLQMSQMFPTVGWLTATQQKAVSLYRRFVFHRRSTSNIYDIAINRETMDLKHLKHCLPFKSQYYRTPLSEELLRTEGVSYALARTGTPESSMSFVYACAISVVPNFALMKSEDQDVIVKKYMDVFENISMEQWEELNKGMTARNGSKGAKGFDDIFIPLIKEDNLLFNIKIAKYVLGGKRYFKVLKDIRTSIINKMNLPGFIIEIRKAFANAIRDKEKTEFAKTEETDYEYQKDILLEQLNTVIDKSRQEAYDNFKNRLTACSTWVTTMTNMGIEEWEKAQFGRKGGYGSRGFDSFAKAFTTVERSEFRESMGGQAWDDHIEKLTSGDDTLTVPEFIEHIISESKGTPVQISKLAGLLQKAKESAFEDFSARVSKYGNSLCNEVIEVLGNHLGINIYLIDDRDSQPIKTNIIYDKNIKSILILAMGGHFESIGVKVPDTKKITRLFEPSDPLVGIVHRRII